MPPTNPRRSLVRPARLSRWLLVALALAPTGGTARAGEYTFNRTDEVVYGRKDGLALTMDVFRPQANANGAGVIAVISGGWISGREYISPVLMNFWTRRGYTVFAVVHGSQPRYAIPDVIEDVNRAVRFVRTHAADYGVDPDRLGAYGWSAGGHLSLMLATAGGPGQAQSDDPVERASSRVQAVACFYPPTDFLNFGSPGEDAFGVGRLRNYPAAFDVTRLATNKQRYEHIADPEQRRAIARSVSPINHVSPDDPPALFIHGDADALVPLQQSEIMIARLKEAGVETRLLVRPGRGHGWNDLEPDFNAMIDWFDAHLGRKSPAQGKPSNVPTAPAQFKSGSSGPANSPR